MAETSARAWFTGTPEEPIINFDLPSGAKGEPGIGWNTTLITVNTDLNTVKTPGVYALSTSEGSHALSQINNYPPITAASWSAGTGRGVLTVTTWAGNQVIQEYQTLSSNAVPPTVYRRTGYAASWSLWYTYTPQRVSNVAGRALYTWDDTQNREQLIYGDTGWRSVKDLLNPEFTASSLRIRRVGTMVTVGFDGLTGTAGGHVTFLPAIPGFAADSTLSSAANQRLGPVGELSGTNMRWVSPEPGAGALRILNYVANQSVHGTFTYFTADPWPTTLPGTANGPQAAHN